jgi:transposase
MDYLELPLKVKEGQALSIKNPVAVLNEKNIGYFFVENIFNKLGIPEVIRRYKSDNGLDYDILGITKLLVFGRVLDPQSKKATFDKKGMYLFPVTTSEDLNEIYKTLDVLYEKCESIQKRMNTKIQNSSIGRDASITYYDVTNYFFETHYSDEDVYKLDGDNKIIYENGEPVVLKHGFRKRGACKKHSGKPLVSMGLFMDSNNIPVAFNVFPGNTHESTGFKETVIPSLNDKNLGKVVLVADNGMYDQKAQMLLINNGNGYIISKSVRES